MNRHPKTYQTPRVIISGGGTGGHVFPAIAIGHAIRNKAPGAQLLFVGARGRMEMKKVPQAGFHIIGLDIMGLRRSLHWQNVLLPWKLLKSVSGAKQVVKRFRPDVVIGVGGYASGPLLWAASRQKRPIVIQEQNSFPGLTNRILGKKAAMICVAYEGMERYFPAGKIYLTGNPVRQEVVRIASKREEAMAFFGLDAHRPVLFVTGGSLGARSINEAVKENLPLLLEKGVQLIWQSGTVYHEQARSFVSGLPGTSIYLQAFIDRMDLAYAAADLVVSRAGAIAVSELCSIGKPAILVPSPNVAEDHQTRNAMALVNRHAAILVKDAEAKEKLGSAVLSLMADKEGMHRLKVNMADLSFDDAADKIAGLALSLIRS